MVNLDFGRILLEILASLVIQCTPMDGYLTGTWTWGDGNACWYTISVEKTGDSELELDFVKYEGEVRADTALSLAFRRGEGGAWSVVRFKRTGDSQWKPVSDPFQVFAEGVVPGTVYMNPWETRAATMRAWKKDVLQDGVVYSYRQGTAVVSVALIKGQIARLSLSPTGKLMDQAEHVLTREGGEQ